MQADICCYWAREKQEFLRMSLNQKKQADISCYWKLIRRLNNNNGRYSLDPCCSPSISSEHQVRRRYRLCHCRRRLHHGRSGEGHRRHRPHPRRGRVVVIQKQKHLNQVIVHFVVVIVVDVLVVIITS